MHHLPVRSNLVDRCGISDTSATHPLCPKPRRAGPSMPDFLKPFRCTLHSQQSCEGRSEFFSLIDKTIEGKESVCAGCSPSCFAGSPPRRTGNPLIHDVQFIHQTELLPQFSKTKLSNSFSSASPV